MATVAGGESRVMDDELLTVAQAAARLGLRPTTLYDWLGRVDYGLLEIRGARITIEYFQGGPKGQGAIRIEAREVQRLKELMRVTPKAPPVRRPSGPITKSYPGISVPLGRPDR